MSDEYVTNPTTGRPVRKQGRVYRQLVRNGWFLNVDIDGNEVDSTYDSTYDERTPRIADSPPVKKPQKRKRITESKVDCNIEYY